MREQDLGYQERLELWKTIRDEIKSIHGHFQDIWNRCEAAKEGNEITVIDKCVSEDRYALYVTTTGGDWVDISTSSEVRAMEIAYL